MIELKNVSKSFSTKEQNVLKDIDLSVNAGELMVLLGESGSGKTTLLKMINGLEQPSSGKIKLGGNDLLNLDLIEERRNIGYVIQHTGLFPHYTVYQNIALIPQLKKWDQKKILEQVKEWMARLGLSYKLLAHKYPKQLSGGQAQRVGLARALISRPNLVLMDEPFSALDPVIRAQIRTDFQKIQAQEKFTVVLVTHDLLEAISIGDRICFLHQGKVEQLSTPLDFVFKPSSIHVSDFIKSDITQAQLASVKMKHLINFIEKEALEFDDEETVLFCLNRLRSDQQQALLKAFFALKDSLND